MTSPPDYENKTHYLQKNVGFFSFHTLIQKSGPQKQRMNHMQEKSHTLQVKKAFSEEGYNIFL